MLDRQYWSYLTCEIDLKGGDQQIVRASALWIDPIFWGRPPYGEPVLYFLQVDVSMGDDLIDQIMVRFGFREIWAEEDRLLLKWRAIGAVGRSHYTLRIRAAVADTQIY